MAKKPVSPTLADVVNSPEYKGMSESVKRQIENALLESKGKPPLPKTNKTSLSTEEVLANPAIVKAIKEKIGEEAAEDFIKKADEKTKIDDTDKLIVVDKQNKVRKTKQSYFK
jgi:phosphoenolpyruvate carboxylase